MEPASMTSGRRTCAPPLFLTLTERNSGVWARWYMCGDGSPTPAYCASTEPHCWRTRTCPGYWHCGITTKFSGRRRRSAGMQSSGTSQPSMTSVYYALKNGERTPELDVDNATQINHYWEDVRKFYTPFEKGLTSPQTEVYSHEMPGGQYTNLQSQAAAVGLGLRFDEVKVMYHTVNMMFGDIIKVTPSSKVVGDMALFMVQNDLSEADIYEKGETLNFPESVISFFAGYLGHPLCGFPKKKKKIILKDKPFFTDRPGLHAPAVSFEAVAVELTEKLGYTPGRHEVLSYILYPQVFLDYQKKI